MTHGILITFEGSEGCGKSTQIDRIARRIRAMPRPVTTARDPGTTAIGEAIRPLLKRPPGPAPMSHECELFLFLASRAQLAREIILPALARGECVLCDRYLDSTAVYQGVARALDPTFVAAANDVAIAGHPPDLTILLDMDPAEGMRRARSRPDTLPDRMESEPDPFYRAIRDAYLARARREASRFLVIDATAPPDAVEREIWHHLEPRLNGLPGGTGS